VAVETPLGAKHNDDPFVPGSGLRQSLFNLSVRISPFVVDALLSCAIWQKLAALAETTAIASANIQVRRNFSFLFLLHLRGDIFSETDIRKDSPENGPLLSALHGLSVSRYFKLTDSFSGKLCEEPPAMNPYSPGINSQALRSTLKIDRYLRSTSTKTSLLSAGFSLTLLHPTRRFVVRPRPQAEPHKLPRSPRPRGCRYWSREVQADFALRHCTRVTRRLE